MIETHKSEKQPTIRVELSEQSILFSDRLDELMRHLEQLTIEKTMINDLIAFSRSLLADFHNLFIKKRKDPLLSTDLFISLTDRLTLKQVLHPNTQPEGSELNSELRSDTAALLIIYSRLSSEQNQLNNSLNQYTDIDQIIKSFNNELSILIMLPLANLHLKLIDIDLGYDYLSRDVVHSARMQLFQLFVAFLIWVLLNKIPKWLVKFQRFFVKEHLNNPKLRFYIRLLRLLQYNAPWAIALTLFTYCHQLAPNVLREWVLIYDLSAIMAFYLILMGLTGWSINNTYRQAHLFISKTRQLRVDLKVVRFSQYITLLSIFYIIIHNITPSGIASLSYQVVLMFFLWFLLYRLIEAFYSEFQTHLSKKVSSKVIQSYHSDQHPFFKHLLVPPTFIGLQISDLLGVLHLQMLKTERYQTLSARFLKLRLEKSGGASPTHNTRSGEGDILYESWFLNRQLIQESRDLQITSPNLNELNLIINEWVTGAQEENNLAIIGECGCGKSILVKQWHEQWEQTKAHYITIPEKIVSEDALFNWVFR